MRTEQPNADYGVTQSNGEEERDQSNGSEGGTTGKLQTRAKSVTLLDEPEKAVPSNSGMFSSYSRIPVKVLSFHT